MERPLPQCSVLERRYLRQRYDITIDSYSVLVIIQVPSEGNLQNSLRSSYDKIYLRIIVRQ